ncbi:hypothetical protein PC116_g23808, partial [Phytophthora cactorum]
MVEASLVFLDVKGGSVNVVDIDTKKLVGHLQQAIAKELKYDGKASDLQLFLAKTDDGAWLQDDDPGVLELDEGRIHRDLQTLIDGDKMKATWTIKDV